ncbi:hypothetical protein CEXT_181391 [Caerostris extrusa]|uniref:Uncharacterized protein n=1 Tax=Caerostris extrusa TaxID=172846 RepID=A0AAV4T5H3_CAEEX|nr:hypothetical protein CEXT_181391 [Caerostris extrusa]
MYHIPLNSKRLSRKNSSKLPPPPRFGAFQSLSPSLREKFNVDGDFSGLKTTCSEFQTGVEILCSFENAVGKVEPQ